MGMMSAIIVVSVTGVLGAAILAVASQYMKVEDDPRTEAIHDALPGVNCGACGYVGCEDYAEAITQKGAACNLCIPGGDATARELANIMGLPETGSVPKKQAQVACQGSLEHTVRIYEYQGINSCEANVGLHGGNSSCAYGCLGYGDCLAACMYGAIVVENGVARILSDKCTGCGSCIEACPKSIITLTDAHANPSVLCSSHLRGKAAKDACTIGCIACKLCERACKHDAVKVLDNLAVIDIEKCINCGACVLACPTKCIMEAQP